MIRGMLFLVLFLFIQTLCYGSSVKVMSKHSVEDTVKLYGKALITAKVPLLLEKPFEKKLPGGFSHSGKELQFSNPFYGRSLGECHRGIRKDKPMSAKVYKDTNGQVWLEYASPEDHINSFGVIECGNEADMVRRVLEGFADSATE